MDEDLTKPDDIRDIKSHYDSKVDEYNKRYFSDRSEYDPALIVEELLIERILELDADRVLDMGCGNGSLVHALCENGVDAVGFDLSGEMISAGRSVFEETGHDPTRLKQANFKNGVPFEGTFDVVTGLGLFPHLEDTHKHLRVVKDLLNPDGVALIQFRNALFNMFSMNRYTYDYVWNTILSDVDIPSPLREQFDERLRDAYRVDGDASGRTPDSDKEGKFHVPMVVKSQFEDAGFDVHETYFYHYHPLPPEFRAVDEEAYDELSRKVEDPNDWRGYLLASSFVIEGN